MRLYALKYLYSLLFVAGCMSEQCFAQQPAIDKKAEIDSLAVLSATKVSGTVKKAFSALSQLSSGEKLQDIKMLPPGKQLMDSLLRSGKSLVQSTLLPVNLFKPGSSPLKINEINADVEYTYLRDTTGLSTGILKSIQSTLGYNLAIDLSVANMPFDVRLAGSNGMYSFYNNSSGNFPQFNFNHQKYLGMLQRQVLDKVTPEAVLSSVLSRINAVKSQYEASLSNEIKKIQMEFESEFNSALRLPPNIADLSVNDLASLKSIVMPQDVLDDYRQGNEQYQEVSLNNSSIPSQKDSLQKMALQRIRKYEALGKIYNKITGWKEKFDGNPMVKELRSHLPFTPGNFSSFIKKPGNLIDVIKGHASLSGIQKSFLNITKLDIGVNPLNGGELNMQNLMNNGINAEFTGKRSSAGIVYGSGRSNSNSWLQGGLNSFTSNEYSRLMGVKFGSGWNNNVRQSLSINFFDFNTSRDLSVLDPAMSQTGYLSAPARRDAVITWQSSFDISAKHKVSVDLSKSFGSYNNNFSKDSTATKNNAFGDIFGSEGRSNLAAAIDYNGELFKTDVQVSFKKAGLGYNNPGNIFIRRGETRIGLGLGRKLLKQKLTVRYKTDYRSQHFDPSKKYTYNNFSNSLQIGYRLKRSTRFGMSLRHNSYRFNNDIPGMSIKGTGYSLQGDAGYLVRIKDKKVISNFSLSRQSFDMPMLTGDQYSSKTWLVSNTSSVVLGKNLMTLALLVNQSDNKDYYFNTSFINTELNYGYTWGDKIRLSSGAGFYSNTGWNKQVGLKQQISATLFKKMYVDVDITCRKAVETIRKELANQVYISSSVHYRF